MIRIRQHFKMTRGPIFLSSKKKLGFGKLTNNYTTIIFYVFSYYTVIMLNKLILLAHHLNLKMRIFIGKIII